MICSKLLMVSTRVIMVEIMKVTRSGFKKKSRVLDISLKCLSNIGVELSSGQWNIQVRNSEKFRTEDT